MNYFPYTMVTNAVGHEWSSYIDKIVLLFIIISYIIFLIKYNKKQKNKKD